MHVSKYDIPTKIDAPGAVARQLPDFGEATGTIGAEYISLGAGTDLAPLLQGLAGDLCHSAHWGYVIEGDLASRLQFVASATRCAAETAGRCAAAR